MPSIRHPCERPVDLLAGSLCTNEKKPTSLTCGVGFFVCGREGVLSLFILFGRVFGFFGGLIH